MGSPAASPLKARFAAAGESRIPFNHRALTTLGFCTAAMVLLLVGGVSYHSAQTAHERALSIAHTHAVLHAIQETLGLITDAETGQRGYILVGREEYLEPYRRAKAQYPQALARLRELTSDNPRQQQHIAQLKRYADEKIALLGEAPEPRDDAERLRTAVLGGTGKRLMDQIRAEVDAMTQIERDLLRQRTRESQESATFTRAVILAGFALALGLVLLSYLLLREEGRERERAQAQVRALNQRLERHARQLEVSNRELEGFSYSVSHDLRIPLRAVAGYAQMLEEDYAGTLGEEGLRMLGVVRANARAMNALIDDLLTFSRLGGKAVQTAEVDMNQVVAGAVEQCMEAAAGAPATEEVLVENDAPAQQADPRQKPQIRIGQLPRVPGDPALLRQVWLNLISNALKYSRNRNPTKLEIGGQVQGSEVVYYVRDNGVGFDMRYAAKLFGVFQRLHGADEYPGTGVGLAIVQRVVTRHGGRVWADARLNEGATFSFALPLRAPEHGADDGSRATD